jgi:ribonuclease HI
MSTTIYCDGACWKNPGKSGSGVIVYKEGEELPIMFYGGYNKMGTNNTAELDALLAALVIAEKAKGKVIIFSDSKYSIDSITNWAYGWAKKGWKKKGGEIKNLEVIKKAHTLFVQLEKRGVSIQHVKGHSGVEGNELADRMALVAIKKEQKTYERYPADSVRQVLLMR